MERPPLPSELLKNLHRRHASHWVRLAFFAVLCFISGQVYRGMLDGFCESDGSR